MHAALRAGRLPVLLAADRARPAAGPGGRTRRALLMVLSTPFHAFLGLTIMQSSDAARRRLVPVAAAGLGRPVRTTSTLAGGILWAGGEFVAVTMLGVLVVQWVRAVRAGGAADRPARWTGPRRGSGRGAASGPRRTGDRHPATVRPDGTIASTRSQPT